MHGQWQGTFLDGKTPTPQNVSIQMMQTGLEVRTGEGNVFFWPFSDIRQTQGSYTGEQIRLERDGEIPEALLISDPGFLIDLHRKVPGLNLRFHNPEQRKLRLKLTVLAGVGAVVLSVAIYRWGIPVLVSLVTPFVPVSWEAQLGKGVFEELAPEELRNTDPKLKEAIDKISSALLAPLKDQPYRFQITVMDNPTFNALAAPGGYIIVYRGLLEETKSADELAGVLAHEFQHVLKRHSTKAILHYASTGILIAALTGDATGAMAFGVDIARSFGMRQHNRQTEREADEAGMKMILEAGVDPSGMVSFFDSLQKKERSAPDFMKYFSTHPAAEDRVQYLKSLMGKPQKPFIALYQDREWEKIKNGFSKTANP